jgi:acetaldehyde dehydrogenase/alcohol dehydrogenase
MEDFKMAKENNQPAAEVDVQSVVNTLVANAEKCLKDMDNFTQEQVDEIVKAMALAGLEHQMDLAKMAVEETGKGVYEDKITKNIFATEYIYHSIKYDKTVGIIEDNQEDDFMLYAEPIGVIAGVTPVTNPTSTAMFKSIISISTKMLCCCC